MWQRKQTVFLAIAVFCLVAMIFFPIWKGQNETGAHALFPLHYSIKNGETTSTLYFPYSITAILAIAAATVCVLSIIRFNNRMLQLKLGLLNSVLMAGAMIAAVYMATNLIKTQQVAGEYGYGLFMPVVAIICNMVANRFIKKDEKLVRDSDRLR
jgi:hypothetical protein